VLSLEYRDYIHGHHRTWDIVDQVTLWLDLTGLNSSRRVSPEVLTTTISPVHEDNR
jgi:hypothetical protein